MIIRLDNIQQLLFLQLYTRLDNDVYWTESTSYNDIFDAFRLALKFYHFREKNHY